MQIENETYVWTSRKTSRIHHSIWSDIVGVPATFSFSCILLTANISWLDNTVSLRIWWVHEHRACVYVRVRAQVWHEQWEPMKNCNLFIKWNGIEDLANGQLNTIHSLCWVNCEVKQFCWLCFRTMYHRYRCCHHHSHVMATAVAVAFYRTFADSHSSSSEPPVVKTLNWPL